MSWLEAWLHRLSKSEVPYERELLATVLAILGEYAFETHRRRGEANRRLLLTLSEQARAGELHTIVPTVRQQREDEQQFVTGHLNDLRDLAWNLLGALARIAHEEAQEDAAVQQQIQQLTRQALHPDTLDIHTLRQALQTMSQILERREQRHRETLHALRGQVHHLMRELEQARRESTTDPLTGLYNRRAFEECLHHTIALRQLFGYPAAMLLIDIDHFKQINDSYGHAVGDEALRWIAERIVRVCKRKGDFAARYGGEEFAVILRETTLRDAQKLAQQLMHQVQRDTLTLPNGDTLRLTVSIGVSELAPHETAEAWFERTDALLYQAKRAGRNRIAA
ncbi:MAG: GGDEF domain-containing protein [Fimbriimonadales bacterium]|nr:GGDEF domain-containing protein [Fimbriimonadales bacterium]